MDGDASTDLAAGHFAAREHGAPDLIVARLYPELMQIAAARLRRERESSLSTADLVNDAVIRLLSRRSVPPLDRAHFLALASRLMRNILVDHARSKRSAKRRHAKVELCTRVEGEQRFDLNQLDAALIRLGAVDPELMRLVEMRYFGGMTIEDMSVATGLSEPTVKRRWQAARAWLADAISHPIDRE